MDLETKIIDNLLFDMEFASKVIPFTKAEYFSDDNCKIVIKTIVNFYNHWGTTPTKDEIKIELGTVRGLSDKQLQNACQFVDQITRDNSDRKWLIKTTEKYYQDKALMNAVINSADILSGPNKQDTNLILKNVQDALAVSFDTNLGHDYFRDAQKRYESYHNVEDKVSWGITSLDRITGGGISKKNLVCAVAPPGSGKSAFMCCIASNAIRAGMNVLYISMEMSEERIAERIDANLFGEKIPVIRNMTLKTYNDTIDNIKKKAHGRLIIKEYPTSGANVNHFKNLLNELKLKQGFIADLMIVDYLNICASARVKAGQTNSYGINKAISEELRGLAVENNLAMLTATQTNRSGFNNSDFEMTEIGESIGITHIMDFIFALIRNESLDENNQIILKQLKNRYGDLTMQPTITLNSNRDKMMFYDNDDCVRDNPNPQMFQPERRVVPVNNVAVQSQSGNINRYNVKSQPKNDFSKFKF